MIDLGEYEVIAFASEIYHHTLNDMIIFFVKKDNEYYYLYDEESKFQDITRMPISIKNDWINYNKKNLTLDIINKYINGVSDDMLQALKIAKRDIILGKII